MSSPYPLGISVLYVVILTSSSEVERTLTSSVLLSVEYVKVGLGLL